MQRKIKLIIVVLAVLISTVLMWPIAKNRIATFQLNRAGSLEAKLIQYKMGAEEFGTARLSDAQRQLLISSMDWDYVVFGRSGRGIPMCISSQVLEFRAPASSNFVLRVTPSCELAGIDGWTRAGGYMPGQRKTWENLKRELFPSAPEPND
ncbi:MAG: hypothetical protein NDJ72_04225 [Elusimicrobia bacterium]|nr:hypothetical protein [Elusimicrobiota bacterium]